MAPASVGRTLRWARRRAGMTQHDLARAVGMPQPSIARIEAGNVLPRTATLLAILDATGHELLVEPRVAVRAEVREAARERELRSIPRRTWEAMGRRGSTGVLRRLGFEGVPFILVGDLAEVVHGAPRRVGQEFEICHPRDAAVAARLAMVLRQIGASPPLGIAELRADHDIHVTTHAGGLRLTTRTAAGDDYELLARNATRLIIDASLLVHVASLEDLMRVRRAEGAVADLEILSAVSPRGAGRGRTAAAG